MFTYLSPVATMLAQTQPLNLWPIYITITVVTVIVFAIGLWLRPYFDAFIAQRRRPAPPPPSPSMPSEVLDINQTYDLFEQKYRDTIVSQTEKTTFWHPIHGKSILIPREQLFVTPQFELVADEPRQILFSELLQNYPRIALIGLSGSGKTELLQYIQIIQARRESHKRFGISDAYVPVLLSAPTIALALSTISNVSLATFLRQQIPLSPNNYVQKRLTEARFFILLDDLNELYISDAERVLMWLEQELSEYPSNRLIITARPVLQDVIGKRTSTQIATFVDLDDNGLEKLTRQWQTYLPRASETLAQVLQDDAIYSLARTPFHMLMLLTISNAVQTLPTQRAHLYPLYLNTLLSHEEIEAEFTDPQKRDLLQTLAFSMHQHHRVYMERANLSKALRGVAGLAEKHAELFVELCLDSGILLQRGDRCRFTHLNIQEFLVAREVAENSLQRLLIKQGHDMWWREIYHFYSELAESESVIDRVFAQEADSLLRAQTQGDHALTILNQTMEPIGDSETLAQDAITAAPPTPKPADLEIEPEEEKTLILVVDDTPQNLKFARFILQRDNYAVAEANNALEAIEWLKENTPTLILSDIQMPEMDGYEFCRYLKEREETRSIPFIFVTAFSRASKEVVKGLKMGADDYIPRPFSPEELSARIGANVRIHKAEESARRQATILARRNRELALLNQIQHAVTGSLRLDDVIETALEQVQTVLQAEGTSLWFVDHENESVLLSAAFGTFGVQAQQGMRLTIQDSIQGQVVQNSAPFLSDDVTQFTGHLTLTSDLSQRVASVVCVPLRLRDRVIGLLQAVHAEKARFTKDDMNLLNAVADAVTVAIENAWLFEQIRGFNAELEQKVQARTRELVREKEKTETILISIADGLLVTDPDKRIILANPAAESLLDFSGQEAYGMTIESPVFDTPLWEFVRRINMESGDTYTGMTEIADPNNPDKILSFQAHAAKMLDDTDGGYLGTVIVLRDITALQEVDRMKARFMTGITHELKTPLAIITLNIASLLRYTHLPEEKKTSMLQTIQKRTDYLSKLVENILQLSRLDGGMLQLQQTDVNLVEMTENIVDELQQLATEKKLELHFKPAQKQVMVSADPNQIERVIRNLVENAIKYTPEGSVKVTLSTDDKAVFKVKDTGIGLSPEQQERLFERFYRADPSHNIPGTGLGLSITKEVVEAHKGEILVESALGEGSTFTVLLPRLT